MPERLTLRNDPHTQTRDLTARTLQLRSETLDVENRSVEAVLATENPVQVLDLRSYEIIDEVLVMRGAELPAQLPLLESHMRFALDTVLGSVRDLRIDGDKLIGRLIFAEGDERAEMAWNKVRQGHLTDVSVGYRSTNFVDIPAGKTQSVSGRSYTARERTLRISTNWTGRELSLVPIGADPASKIRETSGQVGPIHPQEAKQMPVELRKYLEKLGLRAEASDAEAWGYYRALQGDQRSEADRLRGDVQVPAAPANTTPTNTAPPAAPANPPQQPAQRSDAAPPATPSADEIRRAERQRVEAIRSAGAELNIDGDLITRAINDGWEEPQYSREFLNALRSRRGAGSGSDNRAPAGHVRDRDSERNAEVLGAALMVRHGIALDNPAFEDVHARQALHNVPATRSLALGINEDRRQQVMDLAHRYAHLSAIDICRRAIELDGGRVPDGYDQIVQRAVSGGSLTNIFTTSVNAQVVVAYGEAPDSTMGWVAEADVADFRSNERPRMTKGGGLAKLPRGGTADHRKFDDTGESYKIARYAEQFFVDEQDIIDDSLNALRDVPRQMGFDARRLRPAMVYALLKANANLADSVALFAAGRGNLRTSAALSETTLKQALTDLAVMQENSIEIDLEASHLIVPEALGFLAATLIASAEVRNPAATASTPTANPIRLRFGSLTLVTDSRLDNGVTDPVSGVDYAGDTGDWWLADSRYPAIEFAYRRGTGRRPQLRSFVLDRGQWGVGWDINMDIGAKAIRPSMHKNEN